FISHISSTVQHVKWLVSSRNHAEIEQKLSLDKYQTPLSLELTDNAEFVAKAVDAFIDDKISRITSLSDDKVREEARSFLRENANGTFLWVALVARELEGVEEWEVPEVLKEMPTDLKSLYSRIVSRIKETGSRSWEHCQRLLSVLALTHRPLHLAEVATVGGLPANIAGKESRIRQLVGKCISLLTIQNDFVYFVHQSVKDYLMDSTV